MSRYDDFGYERDELVSIVREAHKRGCGRKEVFFSNDLLVNEGIDIERLLGYQDFPYDFGDDISLTTREEYERMTAEDLEGWSILIDAFKDDSVQCVITNGPEVVVDTFDTLFPKYVEVYEDRFEVIEDLPTYLGEELASDLNWAHRKVKMDDSLSSEDIADSVRNLVRPDTDYEYMNEFQKGMTYLEELNSYDLDRFMKSLNEHLEVKLSPRFEEELKRSLLGSESLYEEELWNMEATKIQDDLSNRKEINVPKESKESKGRGV